MTSNIELDRQLAEAENELLALDSHRAELIVHIKRLQQRRTLLEWPSQLALQLLPNVAVSNQSNQEEKITLFRALFRGREMYFRADLRMFGRENLDTNRFAEMTGSTVSVSSQRFLALHAQPEILFHLAMI